MQSARGEPQRYGARFEVQQQTGAGGAAAVFRAKDLSTGQLVALKVLHGGPESNIDRFGQEGALLASLQHPAIVRYIDHGVTADGERYLAMEWLDGETLEERLLRGALTIPKTTALASRVLEALALAHRKGIVHRDIKPSNLFLPAKDLAQVKVLDFGIARRIFDARRMTRAGTTVGTPMYMSPEQARGEAAIDARADVFSVGCVLYECLTGQPPFTGDTPVAVLAKICLDDSVDVGARCPHLPTELARLLTQMLAKERDRRPDDTAGLAKQFALLGSELADLGSGPVRNGRASGSEPITLTAREHRMFSVILASRPRAGPVADERAVADLRKKLEPFGARTDRLYDGSLIVTIAARSTPTDQAVAAARCALTMKQHLPQVALAIGSGRADMRAQLAIGSVLEEAARMLAGEPAGSVRVDQPTALLLESRFELAGEGKRRHLLFEKGPREAPRTVLGREMPCVGRERELAYLEGFWDECVSEPVARAILVTGAAGGGKSRVRHELLERLQNRRDRFALLVSRADSLRAGAPFALLGTALRSAANVGASDAPDDQRRALAAFVGRSVRPADAPRIEAFLGEIAGVPFPDQDRPALRVARQDPRLMADQTLAAWLDWLDAETAAAPVLLVLEDLHWGDAPSVRLVDAALRTFRDRALMVVAFARPEIDETFEGLWADRDLQRMALAPLAPRAAGKLARHVLGDIPDARLAWLVDRADGNPFLLEELIRVFGSGERPDSGELPATVLGTVQVRFDALGEEAKRVLRAASVYGMSFRREGLSALLGDDGGSSLDDWLQILNAREIVFPAEGKPSGAFVFRHALMRDAAYDMLTAEDRTNGHRLAGAWLEDAGLREAVVLVEHFERGGLSARAAHWCRFAATQALEANDLGAVLERVARGVRNGAEGETLGQLQLCGAQAHFWRGEYESSERQAFAASERLEGGARYDALSELLAALGQQTKYDDLRRWTEEIEAAPPVDDSRAARSGCLLRAACFLVPAGDYESTERVLEAVGGIDAERTPMLMVRMMNVRACYECHRGALVEGIRGFEQALAAAERAGDQRQACEMRVNLGTTMSEIGLYEEAAAHLGQVLETADRLGLHFLSTGCAANLGPVLLALGRAADARKFVERAAKSAEIQRDTRFLGGAACYRALIELESGDPAAAVHHALLAIEAFEQVRPMLPFALAALARAQMRLGRVSEGTAHASEAFSLLESLGYIEEGETFVRLVYAEALIKSNEADRARVVLARSVHRIEELARRLSDPARRAAFLGRVRANVETLALAREIGVSR